MYILKTEDGHTVTITSADGRHIHLGLDPDNLIACFPTVQMARAAADNQNTDQYEFVQSLALESRNIHIKELRV